jgi:hypothetical protein
MISLFLIHRKAPKDVKSFERIPKDFALLFARVPPEPWFFWAHLRLTHIANIDKNEKKLQTDPYFIINRAVYIKYIEIYVYFIPLHP